MSKANNDFFKEKREWSKTKDSILATYLKPYLVKLRAFGKPICYVDCFAGKGKFDDGEDGSPLIAITNINNLLNTNGRKNVSVSGYFIELNHHEALIKNINEARPLFKTCVIPGKFEENITKILSPNRQDSFFLYVDPYGVKALNMEQFNSFAKGSSKSVEMLINFNTWGFFREACRVLGAEFKLDPETEEYLFEYEPSNAMNREELCETAGGDYWIKIVLDYKNGILDSKTAEQELAKGIARAFRKSYKYVLNVPVKSNIYNQTPKYRLFHLTNHRDGCLLMADIMFKRINEANEKLQHGQTSLFAFTTEGELEDPNRIKSQIKTLVKESGCSLTDLLCDYFTEFGIETSESKIKPIIKDLENEGFLEIIRNPRTRNNGTPTTFMSEDRSKKQTVFVRKRQNHENH